MAWRERSSKTHTADWASFQGINGQLGSNRYGDCKDDLVLVVLFAGDSVVPCTPRRDIDVPDPAKMLIGQKFDCMMAILFSNSFPLYIFSLTIIKYEFRGYFRFIRFKLGKKVAENHFQSI